MINLLFVKNIEILIYQEFITQKNFAEQVGISKETANRIIKRGTVDLKTIDLIVNKLPNLNLNWLFYNKGEMWLSDEKNESKPYPTDHCNTNILEENAIFYDKQEQFLIKIEDYVNHLKTEVTVLENFIKKKSDSTSIRPLGRIIREIKKAGFDDITSIYAKKRSSSLYDFAKGDFTITLDGDNCILLESGTGIKHLPLSEANIRNMIAYVDQQIKNKNDN